MSSRSVVWLIIFVFIGLLVSLSGYGRQGTNVDSLYHQLALAQEAEKKITLLNKISRAILMKDRERAFNYATKALELSVEIGYDYGYANAYDNMGHIFYYWDENLAKASQNYLEALKIREKIEDKPGIAVSCNNMGNIKLLQQDYEKAREYYQKNIEINKQLDEGSIRILSYSNLAAVEVNEKNYRTALKLLDSSIRRPEGENRKYGISVDYGRMGNIYKSLNNPDSALFWYHKALKVREEIEDTSGIIYIKNMIASQLAQKGNYDEALTLIYEIQAAEKRHQSFYQKQYALETLSFIFEKQGKHEEANAMLHKLIAVSDSLFESQNNKKIAQAEMQYFFEKERALETMKREQQKLKYTIIVIGFLMLILILLFLLYRHRNKARTAELEKKHLTLQKKHLETELDMKEKEVISSIMKLAEKNEVIDNVVDQLKKHSHHFSKSNYQWIKGVIKDIESTAAEEIWEQFEKTFVKLHSAFYTNIEEKHPDLTPNEKRLCAFLKLNLTTKEIATILHLPASSVETARVRLRKKLGLANTKTGLTAYISTF